MDDPCVLFALSRESAPFCRRLRPGRVLVGSPCPARFCGVAASSVLIVETGIGQAAVSRVLDWLMAEPKLEGAAYRPRFLTFAGFGGALTDGLRVGDVVLADEVLDANGQHWRTTRPLPPDGAWRRGRLLTMDRLVETPAEKRLLGEQHRAMVVDMESAVFARRCTEAGVPFACIRAISDEVATPLSPALATLLAGGDPYTWRVLRALARQPSMLPELWRLARDTKRASIQLGLALEGILKEPRTK